MAETPAKPIIVAGGGKGGVGKSNVAAATIDTLHDAGEAVLLVEADNSNPDVMRAYSDQAPCSTRRSPS